MPIDSFPSDPTARRIILILRKQDIDRCTHEPGEGRVLLDVETAVLTFPLKANAVSSQALKNICDSGLLRPGTMLIQSPFDPEDYEEASLASQKFALGKHLHLSELCMYLGAKNFEVEQVDLRTKTTKSTINIKGERLGNTGEVTMESAELEQLRSQLVLQDRFQGEKTDFVAAERMLRERGLWGDQVMRNLLKTRQDSPNPLLSRELTLNLSNEVNKTLSAAARLDLPAFFSISADAQRATTEKAEYSVIFRVDF